jgi:phage-related protein
MSKLLRQPPDEILYLGDWLLIRAMRRANGDLPAREWFEGMDERMRGRFRAAAEIVERSLQIGRPTAGRTSVVRESSQRLQELRITPKGSTPPHLRLFFLRRDRVLWATHGFTKQSNSLPRHEIELKRREE